MEFCVLKTKVNISPLFFAVLTSFFILDKSGIAFYAAAFSALHEAAHFLALLCVKVFPKSIKISLFGIEMQLCENLSTAKKVIIFTAGFAANFIFAALFFIFEKKLLAYVNLAIGIFTALPLSATDGGEVLKSLLENLFSEKAEKIFKYISVAFAVLFSAMIVFISFMVNNYFMMIAVVYILYCASKQFFKK